MQDRPDRKFRFVFGTFRGFSSWHLDDIVPVLQERSARIAIGVLHLLHTGMPFEIVKRSESDTLAGPQWPREYRRTLDVLGRKKTANAEAITGAAETAGMFGKISIYYGYFNPRDGDGWTLAIDILAPGREPEMIMRFGANSHTLVEHLSLAIDPGWIGHVKDIEAVLKSVFDEEATLQEDE